MLLIGNSKARRGEDLDQALDLLAAAGVETMKASPKGREEVDALIRQHAKAVDAVIVGGGDGSLNAAVSGLIETGLPLGIIPMGTANDFARTLGITATPEAAVDVILAGNRRRIDVGTANDRYFLNVASIGLSVRIAEELDHDSKQRFGVLAYALKAIPMATQASMFWAELEHDGELHRVRSFQVSVGNGRYFGGGLTIEEGAAPDDGLLDVCSIERESIASVAAIVPALISGTYRGKKGVRGFSTERLIVRTKRPLDVDLDGDVLTTTPVTFGVRRSAIEVFAPPSEGASAA